MISSVLKVITGILKIRGNTDGTLIGNVNDSLKTVVNNATASSAIVLSATGDFFLNTSMLQYSGVVFKVSGTWVGTIQALGSSDGGSTYTQLPVVPVDSLLGTTQLNINTNGLYYFPVSTDTVKISLTSYTSGTVTVRTSITTGSQNPTQNVLLAQIAQSVGAQSTDTVINGSIAALNGTAAVNAQGAYTVEILVKGTWVGTLIAEGLLADGSTYQQLPMYVVSNTLPYPPVFSLTSNATVLIIGGGYTQIRLRSSAWTSGTALIGLNASLAQQTVFSAQLGNWSMNAVPVDGNKTSYSASVIGLAAANTATDIFTLTGSASKTVRVTRLAITGSQTTATQRDIVLLKRSTANSAGTSTAPTKVPHDSTNAAASATVLAYTANPTTGTLVGNIRTRKVFIATTTTNSDEAIFEFGERPAQAIVLRGTTEVFAVNLNGVTSAGNSLDISIEWTEE